MQIKLLVSAAAIALVAGLGSASAQATFATLDGLRAEALSIAEKKSTVGGFEIHLNPNLPAAPRVLPHAAAHGGIPFDAIDAAPALIEVFH